MHISVSFRILGILLMLFSTAAVGPLVVAVLGEEPTVNAFAYGIAITFLGGRAMWLPVRKVRHELRIRDGFLITSLFWTVLGLFGALPFILTEELDLTVTEAIFESISGLTTTGATVTGTGWTSPPSTRASDPCTTGVKLPGTAMLDRYGGHVAVP